MWLTRPSSAADGDFVLRFSEVRPAFGDLIAVSGTVSGTAVDPRGFGGSGPLAMTITATSGGDVTTTGSLSTTPPTFSFETLAVGGGTGRFVQSSRTESVTCSQFAWALRPRLE